MRLRPASEAPRRLDLNERLEREAQRLAARRPQRALLRAQRRAHAHRHRQPSALNGRGHLALAAAAAAAAAAERRGGRGGGAAGLGERVGEAKSDSSSSPLPSRGPARGEREPAAHGSSVQSDARTRRTPFLMACVPQIYRKIYYSTMGPAASHIWLAASRPFDQDGRVRLASPRG